MTVKELIHVRVGQDAIFDDRLTPGQVVPVEIGKKPKRGDLVAVVYLEHYAGKNKNRGAVLGVVKREAWKKLSR